jgi:hypothetical protein
VGVLLGALVLYMLFRRYRRHRKKVKAMRAPTEVMDAVPERPEG